MTAAFRPNPADVWTRLAAPLSRDAVQWRLDSEPQQRDGRWYARVVAYADVPAVRERLDAVVPGEWDFTATPIGPSPDGKEFAMKGTMQVLGVRREDVGQGPDPKQALTDALKRTARLFGVGIELWTFGAVYVEVDSSSKYAKIVGDPWARVGAAPGPALVRPAPAPATATLAEAKQALDLPEQPTAYEPPAPAPAPVVASPGGDDVPCPKCGGRTWDNRVGKKNPKAPDFKCRDRACDGVIWPPKPGKGAAPSKPQEMDTAPLALGADDIPF